MISKFAAYGRDRSEAIDRMRRALMEYEIRGIRTTLPFFRDVMEDAEFIEGKLDTGFIPRFNARKQPTEPDQITRDVAMIAAALAYSKTKPKPAETNGSQTGQSRWGRAGREMQLTSRF